MTLGQNGGESTPSLEKEVSWWLACGHGQGSSGLGHGCGSEVARGSRPCCLPVTFPWVLLPLSSTMLPGDLLSPFQCRCLSSSSQPGCLCFSCLKFQRGKLYFQQLHSCPA